MNTRFNLGTGITKLVPFYRQPQPQPQEQPKQHKEIITTKLVVTMVIIAIVKIAALILWV